MTGGRVMFYDRNPKVLIVDDTEENIDILVDAFGDAYDLSVALNGEDALEAVQEEIPDLILLDIMMPGMSGYDVCEKLKADKVTRNIPILFLSAITDSASKTKSFELGAMDYITKPFELSEVKARVQVHLELKFAREFLRNQNEVLEELVESRTKEVQKTRAATIYTLAALAETRDPETGSHIKRTQWYMLYLAEHLSNLPKYKDVLTPDYVKLLFESAPLHDIGKVGVSDAILLKPGKLNDDEFEEMKRHTMYGRDALIVAEKELGENSFLRLAREIAYYHHERWDGTGYPLGLSKSDIPLSGRIMALADVYDALISARVYKPPLTHEVAKRIIIEAKGAHFDPEVVDAFLEIEQKFLEIAQRFR